MTRHQMPQGYAGFFAYLAVQRECRFDGFHPGQFSVPDLFNGASTPALERLRDLPCFRGHTVYAKQPRRQRL
jgi:hypothetical protein